MIADPITLYECSPTTDGATAVVVCSKERAKQYTTRFVTIAAYAPGGPLYEKGEPVMIGGCAAMMARKAYQQSGLGPEDIDVAQVHDAFSPGEIFLIEDMGFCKEGEGAIFTWEGNTEIDGKIPVNTDGGLLSRGHPVGATGGAMIAELTWQLRGQAGPRQVANAKVALMHNAGIGGGNVMILKV